MLPTLATIGTGLAWFAATAGQLIFWGAGICVGFWVGKKITSTWDQWGVKKLSWKLKRKHDAQDEAMAACAAGAQPVN